MVSPDGKTVYVTDTTNRTITAVDTATNRTTTVAMPVTSAVLSPPDGKSMYVVSRNALGTGPNATLAVIDTAP